MELYIISETSYEIIISKFKKILKHYLLYIILWGRHFSWCRNPNPLASASIFSLEIPYKTHIYVVLSGDSENLIHSVKTTIPWNINHQRLKSRQKVLFDLGCCIKDEFEANVTVDMEPTKAVDAILNEKCYQLYS